MASFIGIILVVFLFELHVFVIRYTKEVVK